MSVFQDYSKYYDLLYCNKPYEQEAEYVETLIQKYADKSVQHLFEMGVGTARHALCLAKKGYSIDGIDLSTTMLQMGQKQLHSAAPEIANRIRIEQGDVRTYTTSKVYDAAYSLFHVMSYQTTHQDIVASLQTAKKLVKKGGLFIFDCWYGPAVLTQKPEVRFLQLQNDEIKIERVATPKLNENENTVNVQFHLYIQDKNSDYYKKVEESHKMRYFFLPEIEMYCQQLDMRLLDAQEWLTSAQLSDKSWSACFVVKL